MIKNERTKFYQAGDGSWFYNLEDALKWDYIDKIGQNNILRLLKKEWSLEPHNKSRLRKLLQEIEIDEFEDFMSDILGLFESFESMVYEHEGNINLNPEYLEELYPEEVEEIKQLKNQIHQHKQWKELHRASFSFFSKNRLSMLEEES